MGGSRQIEVREPEEAERILTAVAAAKRLGRTRQAVDAAVRAKTIPGFKSALDGRVYVGLDYVEQREAREDAAGPRLGQRVEELERALRELRSELPGPDSTVAVSALKDANLLILAAADEKDAADQARRRARKRLRQYKRELRDAHEHQSRTEMHYREALMLLSVPDTVPDPVPGLALDRHP